MPNPRTTLVRGDTEWIPFRFTQGLIYRSRGAEAPYDGISQLDVVEYVNHNDWYLGVILRIPPGHINPGMYDEGIWHDWSRQWNTEGVDRKLPHPSCQYTYFTRWPRMGVGYGYGYSYKAHVSIEDAACYIEQWVINKQTYADGCPLSDTRTRNGPGLYSYSQYYRPRP